MTADPRAYFRHLRLGDFCHSLPDIQVDQAVSEVVRSIQGDVAGVREVAPGGALYLTSKVAMRQGHLTSSETTAAFLERRVAFANALRSAIGHGNGYTPAGPFVWVENDATDRTTFSTGYSATGSPITITLSADIGLGDGDYVLFTDGSAQYEIAVAQSGTSGTTLELASLANDWTASHEVLRPKIYAPNAYPQELPTLENSVEGGWSRITDMAFRFLTVETLIAQ
ncbi:MAG: hypothetical protein ACPGVG_15350 [Mycobacterium sp.]